MENEESKESFSTYLPTNLNNYPESISRRIRKKHKTNKIIMYETFFILARQFIYFLSRMSIFFYISFTIIEIKLTKKLTHLPTVSDLIRTLHSAEWTH